jgi:hypothetical protein
MQLHLQAVQTEKLVRILALESHYMERITIIMKTAMEVSQLMRKQKRICLEVSKKNN